MSLGAGGAAPAAFADGYSAYSTAVNGSSRHVALSGSTVAFPDGYAAIFINPAGISGMNEDGFDFGSDSNGVDNYVVDLANPKSKAQNVPLKYSYQGFRFASPAGWGFGFAQQTPYDLSQTFLNGTSSRLPRGTPLGQNDQTLIELKTVSYTMAGAKAFFDKRLAVGLALNYNQATESFNFIPLAGPAVQRASTRSAPSADVGLLYRPRKWLQFGASYKMPYHVPFDSGINQQVTTTQQVAGVNPQVNWFRDVYVPGRLAFGLAWLPRKDFRFFAQSDYIGRTSKTSVPGSGLVVGQTPSVAEGGSTTMDGRWGMEFIPIDYNDLTVKFWAGGYLERARIEGGYYRYHRTAGIGFSPWFLSFNAAIDSAELYNNFGIGLGIDAFELAKRVSRFYGWKLPI